MPPADPSALRCKSRVTGSRAIAEPCTRVPDGSIILKGRLSVESFVAGAPQPRGEIPRGARPRPFAGVLIICLDLSRFERDCLVPAGLPSIRPNHPHGESPDPHREAFRRREQENLSRIDEESRRVLGARVNSINGTRRRRNRDVRERK